MIDLRIRFSPFEYTQEPAGRRTPCVILLNCKPGFCISQQFFTKSLQFFYSSFQKQKKPQQNHEKAKI